MDKTYDVSPELWEAFMACQARASEAKTEARSVWEKMAADLGIIPATMSIFDEGVVTGEKVPDPKFAEMKQILLVADVMKSTLSEEGRATVLDLVSKPAVRSLSEQVDRLYDGWTLEAAYSVPDEEGTETAGEVLEGKVVSLLEGESDA